LHRSFRLGLTWRQGKRILGNWLQWDISLTSPFNSAALLHFLLSPVADLTIMNVSIFWGSRHPRGFQDSGLYDGIHVCQIFNTFCHLFESLIKESDLGIIGVAPIMSLTIIPRSSIHVRSCSYHSEFCLKKRYIDHSHKWRQTVDTIFRMVMYHSVVGQSLLFLASAK